GSTLTIGPGILIHGNTGTIDATGAAIVNQGTIASDGGGAITVLGAANFSGGTLTGGSWQATTNSTLRLIGANIVTDAASLLVDGLGSHIYSDNGTTNALTGLAAVTAAGSFTLQNGAAISSSAGFSNAGTLAVGASSSFSVAGDYNQSGGNTSIDG